MDNLTEINIRIHSYESAGTVDGPGIRFVVFMQGCPLRCQYCHNPDTWKIDAGKVVSAKTLLDEILKYTSFMKFSKGGVTFSGGEPLVQKKALLPLLRELKKQGAVRPLAF
jgi:pyruvate formate lyase activating enzyme